MKKLIVVLAVLILLGFIILTAKDAIIKSSIQNIVSLATGLRVEIGALRTSIPGTYIDIRDIVVLNPRDFEDRVMIRMPGIYADFDLPAMLKKQVHLNDLRIDLKEFTVVKKKNGETNLSYIKSLKKRQKKQGTPKAATEVRIDKMRLKIEKIVYKDYSLKETPVVSEYKLNLDSKYRNIKNIDEIMRIITARAIMSTAIDTVSDLGRITDMASGVVEGAKDVLKKTADEIKGIIRIPRQ